MEKMVRVEKIVSAEKFHPLFSNSEKTIQNRNFFEYLKISLKKSF